MNKFQVGDVTTDRRHPYLLYIVLVSEDVYVVYPLFQQATLDKYEVSIEYLERSDTLVTSILRAENDV